MKLDDYVKETLLAVLRGVAAAQEDPTLGEHVGRSKGSGPDQDRQSNTITEVSFDLATTSSDAAKAGGGITVVSIFSAKGEAATSATLANRVQFSVPISVPKPKAQRDEDAASSRRASAAVQRPSGGGWA